ncbi:MAG: poly-beta-1,6-N-acetyl-D-glucosamine N-deacetylase PgaB [Kiritimatiellae bacterium]|nr:poly-beta-1,6-N-acetyl-D-glucosamine N-deacetylase PgaB [Kiritimatiellia bacterium]
MTARADSGDIDTPEAVAAVYGEATTLFKAQKFDQALQRLDDGLAGAPDDLKLLRLKGAVQRKVKDNAGATETYAYLLKLQPDDEFAANFLSLLKHEGSSAQNQPDALIAAGKLDDAMQVAQSRLAENPEDTEALALKGRIHRIRKETKQAIAIYDKLLKQHAGTTNIEAIQALLLFESAAKAKPQAAFEALSQALTLSEQAPQIVEAYVQAGSKAGQHAHLTKTFETLAKDAKPLSDDALSKVGAAYAAQKQYAQSAKIFQAVLERDPDNAVAANGIVSSLAMSDGAELSEARIANLLQKFPTNPDLLFVNAKSKIAAGDTMAALQSVTAANRHAPDHADALNLRIKTLAELGCTSVALELAQNAKGGVAGDVVAKLGKAMNAQRAVWKKADKRAKSGLRNASGLALSPRTRPESQVVGLAYYDVPLTKTSDTSATPLSELISHLEYLRGHDYHFVGSAAIAAAKRDATPLPENPLLLSFDHGHKSFLYNVLPILEQYDAPAVVGIATSWIADNTTSGKDAEFMSWDEIKQAGQHALVTVSSMADTLATHVASNPQGRLDLASVTRLYNAETSTYETEKEYTQRIDGDLNAARQRLQDETGIVLDMVSWPEGAYNQTTVKIATDSDYGLMFGLADGLSPQPGSDRVILRWQAKNMGGLGDLAKVLHERAYPRIQLDDPSQGLFVDLDAIATGDRERTRDNINALLERVKAENPGAVYLKGYHDPDGIGNVASVYFPNSLLPVKEDILGHIASVLKDAGYKVHIAMPTMSVHLPPALFKTGLYVSAFRRGRTDSLTSWYKRLSPFSKEASELMSTLYGDLAAHVTFDGVLFESDAYLTDNEDYTREALKTCLFELGVRERNRSSMTKEQLAAWSDLKARQIDEFILALQQSVGKYRYNTDFGRVLLAPAVLNPDSKVWLAQNYEQAVKSYDYVVVSVCPESHGAEDVSKWIGQLVSKVDDIADGLTKTAFRVEPYSASADIHIGGDESRKRQAQLSEAGARHVLTPDIIVVKSE